MMQMEKLGNNKFKAFQGFYSILAKSKDFQGLVNTFCYGKEEYTGIGMNLSIQKEALAS